MIDDKPKSDETEAPDAGEKPRARRRPGAAAMARNADARRNPEQLKMNQERLGVGTDHRTEAMKKGKRGTFP
jgi:hypothetical protein